MTGANGKIASRAQNTEYYFRSSVTWSKIGSGKISFRYKPCGHIFDVAGTSIFTESTDEQLYLAGLLNTNTIQYLLEVMSPTLNYETGQISNIPIIKEDKELVVKIVEKNISLSKEDWDEFETSWDFKKHPLV